jgi:tetratricopeptide (TPR) repeat protein
VYLRANEVARTYAGLAQARELFRRCVELDPGFAPAWARLGRCHRVIGKYIEAEPDSEARAEDALRRALDLNPRLTVAHKYYANLEADIGRAEHAVVRLLGEATRHGNDPDLFAGLVHACRYCGLLDESIAAGAKARRLDPNIPAGVEQTLLMMGDVDRLIAENRGEMDPGADEGKPVSHATGWPQRTILKWAALYAPVPWPAGIVTRPEVDQQIGGTPPTDFAADVAALEQLVEAATTMPGFFSGRPHPIFGPLSDAAWMRWAYLHMDHHLRQFGV